MRYFLSFSWLANLQELLRDAQTDTHPSVLPVSVISNLHLQTLSPVSAGADSDLTAGTLARFRWALSLCQKPSAIFKADETPTVKEVRLG